MIFVLVTIAWLAVGLWTSRMMGREMQREFIEEDISIDGFDKLMLFAILFIWPIIWVLEIADHADTGVLSKAFNKVFLPEPASVKAAAKEQERQAMVRAKVAEHWQYVADLDHQVPIDGLPVHDDSRAEQLCTTCHPDGLPKDTERGNLVSEILRAHPLITVSELETRLEARMKGAEWSRSS